MRPARRWPAAEQGYMSEIDRLKKIMDRLRGPDGCPWDREQTYETLATYLLEESYEVVEALRHGSPADLREELGDLLFQIVFQARIAQERGDFDLEQVMKGGADKIVRRHPHVFGDAKMSTADQVLVQWEQIKTDERRGKEDGSIFSGVPASLPALLKALRTSSKASRVGFDWPDRRGLLAKVDEELTELRAALEGGDRKEIAEELGDLLFTLANVARQESIDPEAALQDANRKFVARFRYVEDRLREEGLALEPGARDRMEALWTEAKSAIRKTSPVRTSPSSGTSGSAPRGGRRGRST
jgi:tetrapyrrole methylase family protein/MazG family protein